MEGKAVGARDEAALGYVGREDGMIGGERRPQDNLFSSAFYSSNRTCGQKKTEAWAQVETGSALFLGIK